MRIPLHGNKSDLSVHRQLMVNATGGRGFRSDFMERTMVQLGLASPAMFKPEQTPRQKARAAAREQFRSRYVPA